MSYHKKVKTVQTHELRIEILTREISEMKSDLKLQSDMLKQQNEMLKEQNSIIQERKLNI